MSAFFIDIHIPRLLSLCFESSCSSCTTPEICICAFSLVSPYLKLKMSEVL